MSRRLAWSVTLFVLMGTLAVAQKVVGPEEFDRAMKTIGTAIEGVNQAIGSTSYVDAKTVLSEYWAAANPESPKAGVG